MTLIDLIVMLLIAAVIGFIGQALGGYRQGGLLMAIFLGFIGALLGSWLAAALGLPELFTLNAGGMSFPIVWSIVGAALLVALLSLGGRGGFWSVTPPTRWVLGLAVLLALLSLLVTTGAVAVSVSAYTLMSAAFLVLLLGVLVKGL